MSFGGEGGLLKTEANTLGTLQMLKHERLSCPSGGEGGLLKTEANTLGTLQMLKHEKPCMVPIIPAWSSFKFRQLPREAAVENVGLH